MKRKLVGIGAFLLLVGAIILLLWFSRSAQRHWTASQAPHPGKNPSLVIDPPENVRWTASAPLKAPSTNSATPTNKSPTVK
jgi:hypothetical protein